MFVTQCAMSQHDGWAHRSVTGLDRAPLLAVVRQPDQYGRMRIVSILVSLAVLASACTAARPAPGSEERVLTVADGRVIRASPFDNARLDIEAPRGRVWTALLAVYGELGIQPTVADESGGLYGNRGFMMPQRLRDKPASEYFDCGVSIGGASRALGRLSANVQTQLTSTPRGTTVVTHVSAMVRSSEGTSTAPLPCGSTGVLEQLIHGEVKRRLVPF